MTNHHKGFNPETYIRRARKQRSLAFWSLLGSAHRAEEKNDAQK